MRKKKEEIEILKRKLYWKDKKIESLSKQNESLENQINNIMKLDIEKRKRRNKNGICNKT